ncbi:MAG: hypothetical protein J7K00_01730 [Candidatus Diapherotrites archaeon]|nr:hypothetical protein [Candidatus Diapherotrites archaeon]
MLIATDLDEVLAGYLSAFLEFHNDTYKTCLSIKNMQNQAFHELLEGTEKELIEKLYAFYKTPYFKNIKPVPGAIKGISELEKNHELVILTARQNDIKEPTKKWVEHYFPNTFSDIYFTNNYSKKGKKKTKAEVCSNLGVNILIEDRAEYAINCSFNGTKVILLDYPWNQEKLPENIYRVNSWKEIVKQID